MNYTLAFMQSWQVLSRAAFMHHAHPTRVYKTALSWSMNTALASHLPGLHSQIMTSKRIAHLNALRPLHGILTLGRVWLVWTGVAYACLVLVFVACRSHAISQRDQFNTVKTRKKTSQSTMIIMIIKMMLFYDTEVSAFVCTVSLCQVLASRLF